MDEEQRIISLAISLMHVCKSSLGLQSAHVAEMNRQPVAANCRLICLRAVSAMVKEAARKIDQKIITLEKEVDQDKKSASSPNHAATI